MKRWYFNVDDDKIHEVEAETFEIAYADLCRTLHVSYLNKITLIKFKEKPAEPDPTAAELEKKSEELWKQVSFDELKQAEQILKKNFEAMKVAVQFDAHHRELVRRNPQAHANDVCQLKHAEKCIDEFHMWFEY